MAKPHPKPIKIEKKKVYFIRRSPIKRKPSKIKRFSKKRQREENIYKKEGPLFLEDKICPITGGPATQIHHKMGRRGYADEWAKENKITLLNDKRFWLAVSDEGHKKIEANPAWAYKMGYSLKRIGK